MALLTWGCGGDDDDNGGSGAGGSSAQTTGGNAGVSGEAGANSSGSAGAESAGAAGSAGGAAGEAGVSGISGQAGEAGQGGEGGQGGGAGAGGAGGASGSSGASGEGGAAGVSGGSGQSGAAGGGVGVGGAAGSAGASGVGGATAGASGKAGAAGSEVALTQPPFDWTGVIGTGHSLSVGAASGAAVSTKQPYKNVRLSDGGAKYPLDGTGTYALAPLTEPAREHVAGSGTGYDDGQYPDNVLGETPHSSMANQLSALWAARGGKGDYITAHSAVGWSGHELACIDKSESTSCGGGTPTTSYRGAMAEAKAFKALATAAGKSFGYGAVILTGGEGDASSQDYGKGVVQLQLDYEADLQAITGQKRSIPLLASQQSTYSGTSSSAVQLWQASLAHPGAVVCTGPRYAFSYTDDGLHLPAGGQVQLGEKIAEVLDQIVNQGVAWRPLGPDPDSAPSVSGAVITVPFHVPNPPLQWDDSAPPNHQAKNTEWAKGRGFEVSDGKGQRLTITGVELVGSAVAITLDKAPDKMAGLVVGYALTQDGVGTQGGMVGGLRGDLRDSDDLIGLDAETLAVVVTQGSTTIKSTTTGQFAARTGRDRVKATGFSPSAIVAAKVSDDELTLSEAWAGKTGAVTVQLHHDLRNYAVHFWLPVVF